MSQAIGIDLGGTHLRAALVDVYGNVLRARKWLIEDPTPHGCLEAIENLLAELGPLDPKTPVGLGLAGQIDTRAQVVRLSPNLHWHDVPFARMLAEHTARPVRMVNDLNGIAMGEFSVGAAQGASHMVCVFVGTGVGMGAVCDGKLLEGSHGYAAELGHIKVESTTDGRLCGCGQRGCLETYTAGRHLPNLFRACVAAGHSTSLATDDTAPLTASVLENAAMAGDPAALHLWDAVGQRLGVAIANTVTLFNPEVLVLGGGVLSAAPSLVKRVERTVMETLGTPQREDFTIRVSGLGDDAGLVGAALLALNDSAR